MSVVYVSSKRCSAREGWRVRRPSSPFEGQQRGLRCCLLRPGGEGGVSASSLFSNKTVHKPLIPYTIQYRKYIDVIVTAVNFTFHFTAYKKIIMDVYCITKLLSRDTFQCAPAERMRNAGHVWGKMRIHNHKGMLD